MQTCLRLRTTQWLRGNTNTFLWPLRSDLIMISWWAHGPRFRANEALIRIFSRHIQVLISFKRGLRYELNVMGNGRCEGSYEESLRVTRESQKLNSCDAAGASCHKCQGQDQPQNTTGASSQFLISQFIITDYHVMRSRIWKWRRHPG